MYITTHKPQWACIQKGLIRDKKVRVCFKGKGNYVTYIYVCLYKESYNQNDFICRSNLFDLYFLFVFITISDKERYLCNFRAEKKEKRHKSKKK